VKRMLPFLRWALLVAVVALGCSVPLIAQLEWTEVDAERIKDEIRTDPDRVWYVRLINGDVLTGPILAVERDEQGYAIRIGAVIGRAKVYVKEIAWIEVRENAYRHRHRTLIMPTAEPIGNDHYLGLWELGFLYAGAGIADVVSITAGRTFVPGLAAENQVSHVNIKATLYEAPNGIVESGKQFYAAGVTGSWVGSNNFMGHIYGVATFTGARSQATTMFFAKVSGEDFYTVGGGTLFNPFNMNYPTGSVGIGLSMETRFPDFHDLHVVGELWNNDLTRPANTLLYLGVRTANEHVGMDFGLALFSAPAVVPMVAFSWTPF
jgi:hypothetical protein